MMKLLIANWKASINKVQAIVWLEQFLDYYKTHSIETKLLEKNISIVICPPFPLIPIVNQYTKMYGTIKIGSQTISSEAHGAFTGEVTAELLKDYVSYAIVGHSERRANFHLSEEEIAKQINQCTANNISPILCVRNEQDTMNDTVQFVAYEPVNAIGSGHNADVQSVIAMKQKLGLPADATFIYGGSVDAENITQYLQTGEIDGFLVGTASLQAESFIKMVKAMII